MASTLELACRGGIVHAVNVRRAHRADVGERGTRLAKQPRMHTWPWCYEPEELRRDRRWAALILATFTAILVMWTTTQLFLPPPPEARCSHDVAPARALAKTIEALAVEGTCGDALARLPEVVPAVTLRADPWGSAWSIRCHGDLAVVRSAGPDGEHGTDDDVVAVAPMQPGGVLGSPSPKHR